MCVMIRRIPLLLALCCAFHVHAQERYGLLNSNYAGTDALPMNPARMADQWSWMDINIIGADLFIRNDHVSVGSASRTVLGEMRESIRSAQGNGFVLTESVRDGGRRAFTNVRVVGPSLALTLGRNSVGASVGSRFSMSFTGIDRPLARFAYNGLGFSPQWRTRYQDENIRLTAAAWTEFNLSYARLVLAEDHTLFSIGATAKYLLGHGGVGLGFDVLDYTVLDSARAQIHEASGHYGLAVPSLNAGRGLGLDLGAVFTRTLEQADGHVPHKVCEPLPYDWRLGASLMDLGGIRYRDAMAGTFSTSRSFFPDYTTIQLADAQAADSLIAASLSTFERSADFSVGLPTAFAMQLDKRVVDHVYVAANWVQSLSFPSTMRLRRPNTLALVPRLEWRRFEAAIPVVVHEYAITRPSVGLMLRLNNIVVGSDDLLPLISRRGLFGTDLYFRVKWTIFKGPRCRGGRNPSRGAGGRTSLPCMLPR
jgi:hypothetical protein